MSTLKETGRGTSDRVTGKLTAFTGVSRLLPPRRGCLSGDVGADGKRVLARAEEQEGAGPSRPRTCAGEEVVPVFVEGHCHDPVGEVEGLLNPVPVVDVNVNVEHAGVVPAGKAGGRQRRRQRRTAPPPASGMTKSPLGPKSPGTNTTVPHGPPWAPACGQGREREVPGRLQSEQAAGTLQRSPEEAA